MRNKLTIILFGLLISVGWTNVMAQSQPSVSPAERLALSLVDNVSVYDPVAQTNTYTNTLQLTQPANNKLTAGMLNNGDNHITITRQGIKENAIDGEPVDVATVNLSTVVKTPQETLESVDFENYSGGASVSLESPWASSNVTMYYQGTFARIGSNGYVRYTIPEGYEEDGFFQVYIYAGSTGTFYLNGSSWSVTTTGYNRKVLSGLHTGNTITITGQSGSYSPYFAEVAILWSPRSFVPSFAVTPSTVVNGGEATVGSTVTYSPNDFVGLNDLANIQDRFTADTRTNSHPDAYYYKADLDANIEFPSGSSQSSFSASADFSTCHSDDPDDQYFDPSTGTFTGDGSWFFYESYGYETNCAFIEYYGSMLFTMPNTFTGNSVNVTVTSGSGADGAGDLVVNGQSHTFTVGSTYTWTLPVSANGTIEFKSNESTWSIDIATIVITAGNGSSLSAPSHAVIKDVNSMAQNPQSKVAENKAFVKNQKAFKSIAIIND